MAKQGRRKESETISHCGALILGPDGIRCDLLVLTKIQKISERQ